MRSRFPTPYAPVMMLIQQPHCLPRDESHFALHEDSPAPRKRSLREGKAIQPHRAYTLSTRALLQRNPLDFARSIGWRSLDVSESGKVTTRLVGHHLKKGKPALLEVHTGDYGEETIKALTEIKGYSSTREFEFRYLVLPQIYTKVIWLHSSAQDCLIPLRPAGVDLPPGKIYRSTAFFAAAARFVKWRLADRKCERANRRAEKKRTQNR